MITDTAIVIALLDLVVTSGKTATVVKFYREGNEYERE